MSKTPTVSQVSTPGSVIALIILALLLFAGLLVSKDYGIFLGASSFLILRLLLRLIAREHRRGLKLVSQQRFNEAIPHFLQSYDFFDQRRWLDNYRAIFLLSPSAISYREMALNNVGFCYSQIGDGANARKYYEQCLARFPQSGIAAAALKMMNAASELRNP